MKIVAVFFGLAEGIVIGTVVAAVMTKLLMLPRLSQIMDLDRKSLRIAAFAIPVGIAASASIDSLGLEFGLGGWALVFPGLMLGVFVGLFAMAIAEFIMVIPQVSRVFKGSLTFFTLAVILGRTAGALWYWLDTRWIL